MAPAGSQRRLKEAFGLKAPATVGSLGLMNGSQSAPPMRRSHRLSKDHGKAVALESIARQQSSSLSSIPPAIPFQRSPASELALALDAVL